MLMMTRGIGESVRINGDTLVTVVSVKGKIVRLGFDAPREIKIVREENMQRVKSMDAKVSTLSLRSA